MTKGKIKSFFKDKKVIAMMIEYVLAIECLLMLFLASSPNGVKADTITAIDDNGITWNYTLVNGNATDVYYEEGTLAATASIPTTLDGYPVISIKGINNRNIFHNGTTNFAKNISKVIIPSSVKTIGAYAFENCLSLSEIEIPESVTKIDKYAFSNCPSLQNVILPSNITSIPEGLFWKSGLVDISIPNKVTIIGVESFYECTLLKTIDLPEGLTTVGYSAFRGCSNLKSIGFPNSVTNIGYQVLQHCVSLEKVKLPKNLVTLPQNVFWGCTSLSSVDLPDTITTIYDGAFYESGLETIKLPSNLQTIGKGVFQGSTKLTSIKIPNSVITIGYQVFQGCTSLESITLPENLTVLPQNFLRGCSSLKSIDLPETITTILDGAFYESGLETIKLPSNLQTIGKGVFQGSSKLKSVEFPDTVTTMGTQTFTNCTSLESVKLSNNITEIPKGTFLSCTSLKSVEIPNSVTIIVNSSFGRSGLETITIPGTVKTIEANAFRECTNLKQIILQEGITTINTSVFQGCSELTQVTIPNSVTTLDSNVFASCTKLKDIYVEKEKVNGFTSLDSLTGVYIHYSDCSHEVEYVLTEETNIEDIVIHKEGIGLKCKSTYQFKVNATPEKQDKIIVRVNGEILQPNQEGIYTISNVITNQKIETIEGKTVTVNYVDKDGNSINSSEVLIGQEGENYQTQRKVIYGYRAFGVEPENAVGVYGQEDIVVTYVYEKIPSGIVTIKYIDKDGNELIQAETRQGFVGETYITTRKNITGYKEYGANPENAMGQYTTDNIEIIYIYEKIEEEEVVVKHVDKNGNQIAKSTVIKGEEGEEYKTVEKEVPGYHLDKKPDNENGTINKDGTEVAYVYDKVNQKGFNMLQVNKILTVVLPILAIILVVIVIILAVTRKKKEEDTTEDKK